MGCFGATLEGPNLAVPPDDGKTCLGVEPFCKFTLVVGPLGVDTD
eukprot:CAMPEP_0169421950 /NCGR_PEP_ID=MMETSP1017-20121227/66599_1 /TAXON_ID=342587 /ORGANISM="Karlodinium micrum, Strain CCMP2283" /LENGTH=44 /DNA_ID= /DNA_START= /DNA_END= /DNA_ORIENTATION=